MKSSHRSCRFSAASAWCCSPSRTGWRVEQPSWAGWAAGVCGVAALASLGALHSGAGSGTLGGPAGWLMLTGFLAAAILAGLATGRLRR
jgi:hypothetical protein